jgi:hypothetical protein
MVATAPAGILRRLERVERRRATPAPDLGDPVALCRRLEIEPDPWQADFLTLEAPEIVLLCARQAGKSTIAAVRGLHRALSRPSLVLIVSPTERQSKLLFRALHRLYVRLGHPVPADVENRLSMELANGSEVHALPGSEATVRGFSGVDLLLVDEAARVPDDLYMAVRPMLAVSGGAVVLMSSAFGRRGFFWREWSEGGPGWRRTLVTAYDVPRIDPAWLARERARIGDWWFDQEYLCVFKEAEDAYFAAEDVAAAFGSARPPLRVEGLDDAA